MIVQVRRALSFPLICPLVIMVSCEVRFRSETLGGWELTFSDEQHVFILTQ